MCICQRQRSSKTIFYLCTEDITNPTPPPQLVSPAWYPRRVRRRWARGAARWTAWRRRRRSAAVAPCACPASRRRRRNSRWRSASAACRGRRWIIRSILGECFLFCCHCCCLQLASSCRYFGKICNLGHR